MSYFPHRDEPLSSFGDKLTVELTPRISIKAVYGVRSDVQTFTATGGSATASNSEFVLQTGTSSGGYGVLWSRRPLVYVPGVGAEARVTARFTTGIASSMQACGFFSSKDGMFFGYNGTSFGVMHRYGGSIEMRTLTISAASGGAATATVTLNGTAYNVAVTSQASTSAAAHELEEGLNAGSAADSWYIQHIGSTLVFVGKGVGARSGSYSLSVDTGTLAGSFAQNKAGAACTENWTAQASWNVNACSWLDPTKGNIYKLEYAFLGYGPLKYHVFNPTTRDFVLAHVVNWPNAYSRPNFNNPSLRVGWIAASLGSTTNLTVAGGSGMAALQGHADTPRTFGAAATATSVTTETQILTVGARYEFNNIAANGIIHPRILSIATDSTKGALFYIYRNPTVSGTTVHTYVDQNESMAIYDSAGTTVSGGSLLGVFATGPSGARSIDLSTSSIELVAGDELVVTAKVVSGAAADMTTSLTWDERI